MQPSKAYEESSIEEKVAEDNKLQVPNTHNPLNNEKATSPIMSPVNNTTTESIDFGKKTSINADLS